MAKEPKKTKKAPRKFTKEFQGGRKRLKDVDKSGNRDFGDTFLGDLLGMDKGNKLGVQGAGLIRSLKGVRRESPKKTKPKSPIKKTGSGLLPANEPKSGVTTTKLPPAKKLKLGPPGSARPAPKKPDPKPDPKPAPSTAERQKQAFKKFTSKQWENMSKEERRENDLPVSITSLGAGKYRNFKFKDGTSPLDFMRQLKRGLGLNKGGSVAKKSGYAAGGMAAKKKSPVAKKMMAGGMAKKSGYMYGGMAKKKMKK